MRRVQDSVSIPLADLRMPLMRVDKTIPDQIKTANTIHFLMVVGQGCGGLRIQKRVMKKKTGAERDKPSNGTSTSGRTKYKEKINQIAIIDLGILIFSSITGL